jgi:hypothetical protein
VLITHLAVDKVRSHDRHAVAGDIAVDITLFRGFVPRTKTHVIAKAKIAAVTVPANATQLEKWSGHNSFD